MGFFRKIRDFGCAAGIAAVFSLNSYADDPRSMEECYRSAQIARNNRDREMLVDSLSRMARIYFERDDFGKSLQYSREALDELGSYLGHQGEEKGARSREMYSSLFETGMLAALRQGNPKELYHFMESGRAGSLLESLGGRNSLYMASLPSSLREAEEAAGIAEKSAKEEMAGAIKLGSVKEIRAAMQKVDKASEGLTLVSERIRSEAKKQADIFYPRPASLEETQSLLKDNEAMVLYALTAAEGVAMTIYRDKVSMNSISGGIHLGEIAEGLEERIRDVNAPLGDAIDGLRTMLVKPINLEARVQRVIISPAGRLSYIPFSMLMQDKDIVYTPSGTTYGLLLEEHAKRGDGVLAIGNPNYSSQGLASLSGTQKEIEAIGDVVLSGSLATKGKLAESLKLRERWHAVHFACHGLINPDKPLLSSLALTPEKEADSLLTCLDIFRMQVPADLSVLSACETAKGKIVNGEGIIGLTRAFMYAGSPKVVCSLWKVDDLATEALMIKFYELWNPKEKGASGMGAAAALRKAQEHVHSQEKWSHPYFWAPWELWGASD